MKTFTQFISEIKTISYPSAKSHTVYPISPEGKHTKKKISKGHAVPISTTSGAGDGGGNGD